MDLHGTVVTADGDVEFGATVYSVTIPTHNNVPSS